MKSSSGSFKQTIVAIGSILACVSYTLQAQTPPCYTLISKWGNSGFSNGQFATPGYLATDGMGNVYITDVGNDRVQKFTKHGDFIASWGSNGNANGQFNVPAGIAADASANIFVVDKGNLRIQKFSSDGTFLAQWSTLMGDETQGSPTAIATDAFGNLYVTDLMWDRVQKYTGAGALIASWGTSGPGDGQLGSAIGITVDPSGNVFVLDEQNIRIQKFTSDGAFVLKWGLPGSGNGEFMIPAGIAADASGNVYISDAGINRIQRFSTTGGFIETWGTFGNGNTQFMEAVGMTTNAAGDVYVADRSLRRVQRFGCSTCTDPTITTPPQAVSVLAGRTAVFSVEATGPGLSYQWQISTGGPFTDLVNSENISNVNGSTLMISNPDPGMSGNQFRCIVASEIVCTQTSSAAALTVTDPCANPLTRLYVNINNPTPGDGSNWNSAINELGDALWYARLCASVTEIYVASGTYLPNRNQEGFKNPVDSRNRFFYLSSGVKVYGGFAGNESDESERVPGENETVLSGNLNQTSINTDNAYHVVVALNCSSDTRLDGFTIRDGYANGADMNLGGHTLFGNGGGAMYNKNAPLLIHRVLFANNYADRNGGALLNDASASRTTFSKFQNNHSRNGGAVYNTMGASVFEDSEFAENTAEIYGGAVMDEMFTVTEIRKCTFRSNTAGESGGAFFSTITNGETIESSVFTKNTAVIDGGAIAAKVSPPLKITNSVFSENTAGIGGAIAIKQSEISAANCLIIKNTASSGNGGGISATLTSTVTMRNTTISENSATGPAGNAGGFFYDEVTAGTIANSIFWNNTTSRENDDPDEEIATDAGLPFPVANSIIRNFTAGVTRITEGGGILHDDPLFYNPGAAAGPDLTWMTGDDGYRLRNCSTGINAGDNAAIPDGITTDLKNAPRVLDNLVDLGAYENERLAVDFRFLPDENVSVSASQTADGITLYTSDCENILASIETTSADAEPLTGSVGVSVWLETAPLAYQDALYVARHYQISPAGNAENAEARVTLYFSQNDFNLFNQQSTVDLPRDPTDDYRKANLKIGKLSGISNDGSGRPGSYNGTPFTIDPQDEDIVWNNAVNRWEVSFRVSGFSGFFAFADPGGLPVKLAGFDAKLEENTVRLTWKTAGEQNSAYFEVERADASRAFRTIGRLKAAGNSDQPHSYRLSDSKWPETADRLLYYRIKMVDLDQTFTYSEIKSVTINPFRKNYSLFPVPATTRVTIKGDLNPARPLSAYIADASGRKLLRFEIRSKDHSVDVSNLAPGLYFIVLDDGTTLKLIR